VNPHELRATLREAELVAAALEKKRAKGNETRYVPHTPHAQQAAFLSLDCLEALYGGAAGGGKSDALLMAALQYIHVPGYAAILFRRTYQDLALPGAIMSRSHEWLSGTRAKWDGLNRRWHFPAGASLSFGYLDSENDRYRYQSAEFQFVGFDELTQFPETWFRYLFSRLRKKDGMQVPLRMRGATNPGGIGHEWVRRRYLSGEDDCPPFVPAKLEDNPSVDAVAYEESLYKLDPTTRKQLRDGVWVRDSGGLVYQFDPGKMQVDAAELVDPTTRKTTLTKYVLAIDFGFTDSTAFAILGWRPHDKAVYLVESFKETKLTPSAVAEKVVELKETYKFDVMVGDIGGLGKGYVEEARRRFKLPIEAAEKQNKRGYIDLLNGALHNGEFRLVRGKNDALIAEMAELPWKDDRSKPEDGFEDHLCDAMLYGWRAAWAYLAKPAPVEPDQNTAEWEAMQADKRRQAEKKKRSAKQFWKR
jgi:hypothetical protein